MLEEEKTVEKQRGSIVISLSQKSFSILRLIPQGLRRSVNVRAHVKVAGAASRALG